MVSRYNDYSSKPHGDSNTGVGQNAMIAVCGVQLPLLPKIVVSPYQRHGGVPH
jgi:hypothetical protein